MTGDIVRQSMLVRKWILYLSALEVGFLLYSCTPYIKNGTRRWLAGIKEGIQSYWPRTVTTWHCINIYALCTPVPKLCHSWISRQSHWVPLKRAQEGNMLDRHLYSGVDTRARSERIWKARKYENNHGLLWQSFLLFFKRGLSLLVASIMSVNDMFLFQSG